MNPETLKMMKTMKPTDTRDLSAEDANAIEMHKAWIARDDDPDEHAPGDNGIRAGKAGAALARVWQCSEEEAFNIAVRLMKAGRFRFHLHQWSYAFEFTPETLNSTDQSLKAHALEMVPKITQALDDWYSHGDWSEVESGAEDRYNNSPVVALFVAFGKLVTNDDFELVPAPRKN
ncbi:MAG: hypothetical protein U0269_37785 [Polyangiales bacterium]